MIALAANILIGNSIATYIHLIHAGIVVLVEDNLHTNFPALSEVQNEMLTFGG